MDGKTLPTVLCCRRLERSRRLSQRTELVIRRLTEIEAVQADLREEARRQTFSAMDFLRGWPVGCRTDEPMISGIHPVNQPASGFLSPAWRSRGQMRSALGASNGDGWPEPLRCGSAAMSIPGHGGHPSNRAT